MSAGTKIVLAVIVLGIIFIGSYYLWLAPKQPLDELSTETQTDAETDQPADFNREDNSTPPESTTAPEKSRGISDRPNTREWLDKTSEDRSPQPGTNVNGIEEPMLEPGNESSRTPVVTQNSGVLSADQSSETGRTGNPRLPDWPIANVPKSNESSSERTSEPEQDQTNSDNQSTPDTKASDNSAEQSKNNDERSQTPPTPELESIETHGDAQYWTVGKGDSMFTIAQQWLGDANKWDLISKANPLVDPQFLQIGQQLRLPPRDARRRRSSPTPTNKTIRYVVRPGDTLSTIARSYYGEAGKWRLIYQANRATLGDNPNRLRPEMRLTIPPGPKKAE